MTTQNRQPVLRCVLSTVAHPEYGQVTIPFPIPVMEYERTLECLAAKELGAPLKRDCRVDELESGFPILKRLEKVGANLDELDYLARRLDSFDDYEAAQFQAMAVRLGTFDMTDFINLTFCCQQATVITRFSDLEGIGKAHILTLHGGHMPVDELEQVDGRAEALKLILNEHGSLSSPVAGAKPASGGHPADVKNCWISRAHCGMLCAYQKKGRERAMNHQRKQSMRKNPVEGRLPLWKPAFSIRMTLAAK